jgi:6-pyruvoyltetrahydropterin/6-carboxytetrahydropterin synthase
MPYAAAVQAVFAASHQLRLPDGALEPMHGHNWTIEVEVRSQNLDTMDCVIDFHELQRQIARIIGPWSSRHLNDVEPFRSGINPSAERVAEVIAGGLSLPVGVMLAWVRVGEAPGCAATYRP